MLVQDRALFRTGKHSFFWMYFFYIIIMQRAFKQFVRYYCQQLQRIYNIKQQLNTSHTKQLIQSELNTQHQVSTAILTEYLLKYQIYYTDMQIGCFFKEFFGCRSSISVAQYVSFNNRLDQYISVNTEAAYGQMTEMDRLKNSFNLYSVVNESVKFAIETTKSKQIFRVKYEIGELFKQLTAKYQKHATKQSIAKYLNIDPMLLKHFLDRFQQIVQINDLVQFLQCEQPVPVTFQASIPIEVPHSLSREIEQGQFINYIKQLITRTKIVEEAKQNMISQFPGVSLESIYLLFSSSLKYNITTSKLQERSRLFGKNLSNKGLCLLMLRYGTNNGIGYQQFTRLFTPLHESYHKILSRRKMQTMTEIQCKAVVSLLERLVESEKHLEANRFKDSFFGKLFIKIDCDQDCRLNSQDLSTFFKRQGQPMEGRQVRVLLARMSSGGSSISYSEFVEELQPKWI